MKIISVRKNPKYAEIMIAYFQKRWANEKTKKIYEDCITACVKTDKPLPHWFLLYDEDKIVGGAGLVTNDFISRMDLYPWLCALYIEEEYRGNNNGQILINAVKSAAKDSGYDELYLSTDHVGYYEKFDFEYIGQGYHPWGEDSRIYELKLT